LVVGLLEGPLMQKVASLTKHVDKSTKTVGHLRTEAINLLLDVPVDIRASWIQSSGAPEGFFKKSKAKEFFVETSLRLSSTKEVVKIIGKPNATTNTTSHILLSPLKRVRRGLEKIDQGLEAGTTKSYVEEETSRAVDQSEKSIFSPMRY
jgi:hypothetical protein